MSQRTDNVSRLISRHADSFRLRGDFYTVGDAAALVNNELTPARFYEDVRDSHGPDGYILGAGCGNAISMVEAFAATPLGMILVDVDPAVIFIGNMFVACLRKHATVEGFVEELFCGGRRAFEELEREVLEQDDPFELADHMRTHRDRMWGGLAKLTEDFRLTSGDVGRLLEEWASYYPPAGHTIPVRTHVARNYAKLHELAAAGNIAIVRSTIFEPALIDAVAKLPGFAESVHLVYTSNVVDHILRRAMFTSARWKLRLTDDPPPGEIINSTADFLTLLGGQTGCLDALTSAARGCAFVYSIEGNDLLLEHGAEFPRYAPESFYFQFDLDRLSAAFLGGTGSAASHAAGSDPWTNAPNDRALARGVYTASVRNDVGSAAAGLDRFAEQVTAASSPLAAADPRYAAFWLAELSLAVLFVRRSELAEPLAGPLAALEQAVAEALRARPLRQELPGMDAIPAPELLLFAQAFGLAGRWLGDEDLEDAARPFVERALSLQAGDGYFRGQGRNDVGWHTEALARLVFYSLYCPRPATATAIAAGVEALGHAVDRRGQIDVGSPEVGGSSGYASYVTSADVTYENARLALLFHGMTTDNFELVRDAMRVYSFSRLARERSDAELSEILSES